MLARIRSRRITPPLIAIGVAVLALGQNQPVFQTGTRLVTVDVVVRSDKGGAVRGLTKEDFTLQDKGKTQNIAVFVVTDTSQQGGAKADPLPAGVYSNRLTRQGAEPRGATVILFDRLNIPVAADQAVVRSKILSLLTSLKGTDRVGFYSMGTSLTMVQDYDQEAEPLIQAAKHLSASTAAASSDPEEALLREALTPMQVEDMQVRATQTTQTFATIARHLGGVHGRKNLIWVASDFPLTYGLSVERRANYDQEVDRDSNTMGDANIAVYPMDPRGVNSNNTSPAGCDSNSSGGRGKSKSSSACTDDSSGSLLPGRTAAPSLSGGLTGIDTMQRIANATGGKAYYNTNDIGPEVRKVMDEAEVTYTLGFYVDNKILDGKNHDLTVKVAKKPETSGAQLHYRKNYTAENPQSPAAKQARPEMSALIADALPATSIGLMAVASPDPAKPGTSKVQVRVNVGELQFDHLADKWMASFDLGLSMESDNGKPSVISNKTMNLSLTDEQLKKGLAGGLDVDNSIPSPTKATHLRIVVLDKSSGSAGALRIPVSPQ